MYLITIYTKTKINFIMFRFKCKFKIFKENINYTEMNIIIYFINDEFFKINLNRTFRVILRDVSN